MRVLHTSDWHLGHKLYDRSRLEEQGKFLEWLLELIQEQEIDLLLIAGDVFDTALPSAASTDLYYRFLHRLYAETKVLTFVIAGNHDSGVRLAASREFLRLGRTHVIGKLPDLLEACVCDCGPVAVAALPYLPEGEIVSHVSLEAEIETAARYREAARRIFDRCLAAMPTDAYKILMGHLFLQGGVLSESERPVQVGGSTRLSAADIPLGFDYIALGHLHRPQSIQSPGPAIRYSGTPLPMTFRETEYPKQVVLIDVEQDNITEITVPHFCELRRVTGTYEEVLVAAHSQDWTGKLIEVQVELTDVVVGAADSIRAAFTERGGDVLVVDASRAEQERAFHYSADELRTATPEEIFAAYYAHKYPEGDQLPDLMETFRELVMHSGITLEEDA